MRWCAPILLLAACGDSATAPADGAPDGSAPDAAPIDAFVPDAWPCAPDPSAAQCDNCIDDDADGLVDGWDPECFSRIDDTEGDFGSSFSCFENCDLTWRDCWFDGNSGSGDDQCRSHVCCGLPECPPPYDADFDPALCAQTGACTAFCEPLTRPGCDCFGCCTVCVGDTCRDIVAVSSYAPDCTHDTLTDETICPACTKNPDCEKPCGGDTCALCPGQTAADLPAGCTLGCDLDADCPAGEWCASGTCVAVPL